MNIYIVRLYWTRAYSGTTVYVVHAEDPTEAICEAADRDHCHVESYDRIDVERVDGVIA